MKILTGIDLPYAPSCGSIILCDELYSDHAFTHAVRFLALAPRTFDSALRDLQVLPIAKVTNVAAYGDYVAELIVHVRRSVEDYEPDAIHIQHLCYGMALALSTVPDLPVVAICHGTDVLSALTDPFHRRTVQRVLDRADTVIFPSRAMLADARQVAHVPDEKVRVASWGLPTQYFDGSALAHFGGGAPKRILFAGRLLDGKGIGALLEAIVGLSSSYELTIAGDGPLRPDLQLTVERLGLGRRVRMLGWLEREQLRAEYARHHALVAPSREIEAFCLVAIEAQASGLPVIHARVGGLPEVVDEPDLCFEPADEVNGIAKGLQRALSNQADWKRYSEHSVRNAQRFRLENTAREFSRATEEAVSRRGTV